MGTHHTLINGTSYAIKGGTDLIAGTSYQIGGGRTLVNGTAYEIGFGPKSITITITGTSSYAIVEYNGNRPSDGVYEVEAGTQVKVIAASNYYNAKSKTQIYLNGSLIVQGTSDNNATYTFTPEKNCTISFTKKMLYEIGQSWFAYIAYITEE